MFACILFGIDRQVHYRSIKRRIIKQDKAALAVQMVLEIRTQMPRIGSKKLYYLLNEDLKKLKIGRDKFIDILRANHLLIVPKRSYHVTTNSHHRFRKFKNQLLDMQITKPEQVWVSDIAYIGKREKPCYLSLITDAYSKKIVGYNVSDSLNTESSLVALKRAIKQRENKKAPLIHHSDRGLQYCSSEYQNELSKHKINPSMTQNSDPYENAVAERINGILKQEFNIDKYNQDLPIMKQITRETVEIYNGKRPHLSNNMLTPNQMHQQNNLKMKTYKNKNSIKNVFDAV